MPQIQVWINNDDDQNVEKLVKTLNAAMSDNKEKKLKAFFIFVTDTGKAIEPKLVKIEEKTKASDVCLAYIAPKNEAIEAYKVNLDKDVKNTVMLYRRRQITKNFVNLKADDKGLAELRSAIAELVK